MDLADEVLRLEDGQIVATVPGRGGHWDHAAQP
jgi:hypothetical protein